MTAAKKKPAPEPAEDRYVSRKGSAALLVETIAHLTKGRRKLSSRELSERLVEYSKPEDSPTHGLFGDLWDDAKAAKEARIAHATMLITSVRVYLHEQPEAEPVQWLPVVIRGGVQGREPIRAVMADTNAMASLVERALAEARGWARRHARLREVAKIDVVFVAIEKASKK